GVRGFWGAPARIGVSLGASLDSQGSRFRTPECAKPPSHQCALDTIFGGASYTQIITPRWLAQGAAEIAYLDGFQANLYRLTPFGYERVPDKRLRNALALRTAYYFPSASLALRAAYRYYFDVFPGQAKTYDGDPWLLRSHTFELRAYRPVTHDLTARVLLRFYWQNWPANFFETMSSTTTPTTAPFYYTSDPKLGTVQTIY